MKRTREWWAALTPEERSRLVQMERADKEADRYWYNLPDGFSSCPCCGTPTRSRGICSRCYADLKAITSKADATVTALNN
jgi:hypothetical protein